MLNLSQCNKTNQRYVDLENGLKVFLGYQRHVIPNFALESNGSINKAATGYVFGFIGCAARMAKLEVNSADGYALVMNILEFLQRGCSHFITGRMTDLIEDKTFKDGIVAGENHYHDLFMRNAMHS